MKLALAPLAAALLGAACSGSDDQAERQQPAALLTRAAHDRPGAVAGDPARLERRRAALMSALTPERLDAAASIAGERQGWIVDRAQVLSDEAERALAARSQALEAATSDQVMVVTVPQLGGMSIEEFALALGNRWGIGRADLDTGVLLLVAPSERRVRVEVGCGLETVLTDARAAEIIAGMVELFRQGEVERGIDAGLGEIEAALRARPERRRAA